MKLNDKYRTLINVSIVILLMATFVFIGVRLVSGPYWTQSYFLGDKGSLGDAVNGLSAPFISFFSAILIYVTFREQNKANKLLQSQWQIDTFIKIFNDMNDKLKTLSVDVPTGKYNGVDRMIYEKYLGLKVTDYIIEFHGAFDKTAPPELTEFIYIIDELTFLSELVNESPANRREFMRQKVMRFYYSGFHSALFKMEQSLPKEQKAYRPFWNAASRLHEQIRNISTLGDLTSANGEGQEHQEFKIFK